MTHQATSLLDEVTNKKQTNKLLYKPTKLTNQTSGWRMQQTNKLSAKIAEPNN
jgi:hypothetical protein